MQYPWFFAISSHHLEYGDRCAARYRDSPDHLEIEYSPVKAGNSHDALWIETFVRTPLSRCGMGITLT